MSTITVKFPGGEVKEFTEQTNAEHQAGHEATKKRDIQEPTKRDITQEPGYAELDEHGKRNARLSAAISEAIAQFRTKEGSLTKGAALSALLTEAAMCLIPEDFDGSEDLPDGMELLLPMFHVGGREYMYFVVK